MRIRGVYETAGENTNAVVQEMAARKLEVRVAEHDVVCSHHVGGKTEDRQMLRDVIVRFKTHNMKAAIMRSARKVKLKLNPCTNLVYSFEYAHLVYCPR